MRVQDQISFEAIYGTPYYASDFYAGKKKLTGNPSSVARQCNVTLNQDRFLYGESFDINRFNSNETKLLVEQMERSFNFYDMDYGYFTFASGQAGSKKPLVYSVFIAFMNMLEQDEYHKDSPRRKPVVWEKLAITLIDPDSAIYTVQKEVITSGGYVSKPNPFLAGELLQANEANKPQADDESAVDLSF